MWDATEVKVSELKGTALDWAVALSNFVPTDLLDQ